MNVDAFGNARVSIGSITIRLAEVLGEVLTLVG